MTTSTHTPSIAIVIVNYNYAHYLADAIESALHQESPAQRILVIDDGSTDDSLSLIRSYLPRIEHYSKSNGGQPSAYNAALPLIQEDLVLFLDSDDLLERSCVQHVVAAWQPEIVKLQFPLRYINAQGKLTGGMIPRVRHTGEIRHIALKHGAYISPPSSGNVYTREYLERIFPLNESSRYSADCIPSSLAPCYGKVMSLPQSLGRHRVHQASNSTTQGEGQGLNHSHEPGWLDRAVQRDHQAFLEFKTHLETHTDQTMTLPAPLAPSLLRFMAIHQKTHPPLKSLADANTLCRLGIQASLRYPDYLRMERSLLILWFFFLWICPKPLLSICMKYQLGVRLSGIPQWSLPPR